MDEALIIDLLLGVIMFVVAVIAFGRWLVHRKRGEGVKDRVLTIVMFAVSVFATVSFCTLVIDLFSG